jgi:hypothetical protein
MFQFSDYIKKRDDNTLVNKSIAIFGLGLVGNIVLSILKKKKIKVDYICDNNPHYKDKVIDNAKVISNDELENLDKNINFFICARYFKFIIPLLEDKGFKNLYKPTDLLSMREDDLVKYYKKDLTILKQSEVISDLKLVRKVDHYIQKSMEEEWIRENKLLIKSIDIQVTEKCSLKCKDCCNLMQYYERPIDIKLDVLLKSVERIMSSVDGVDEFRVLGGDPFMNKELYKIINKLVTYEKCKKVVVYTNAKFVPKGENLNCLKNKKIILEITNYGKDSPANDKFVETAKRENIAYHSTRITNWSDSGRILPYTNKSEKELETLFNNCCQSELISLLHGKLYVCPFSANAANLKAIPKNDSDEVNLLDEKLSTDELRKQIKKLCYEKKYITACSYCNGREITTAEIPSAVQTKKPLKYETYLN